VVIKKETTMETPSLSETST